MSYVLKCPWQTKTEHLRERSYLTIHNVTFGDCLKTQCPFWQEERVIGCDNVIEAHCTRVKGE